MRLRDRLREVFSREERHRRKAEKDRTAARHDTLSPAEAAEVFEMSELVHQIKTGEFPIVLYDEPIGPSLPTVDERFALFAADPLGAELPGEPAKDNRFYADVLAEQPLSQPVRNDLESVTGYWTADQMAEIIARGAPK